MQTSELCFLLYYILGAFGGLNDIYLNIILYFYYSY